MAHLTKAVAVVIGLLLVAAAPASASLITLDPDSYADGTVLNNILPGLTLSAIQGSTGVSGNVTALTSPAFASTGSKVFEGAFAQSGQWGDGTWDYLRIDFGIPVLSVTLDFIATDSSPGDENPVLAAYDTLGNLITTSTVPGLFTTGQVTTLTVGGAGIATVTALGDPSGIPLGTLAGLNVAVGGRDSWAFDNLQVEPVPEPMTLTLLGSGLLGLLFRRRT